MDITDNDLLGIVALARIAQRVADTGGSRGLNDAIARYDHLAAECRRMGAPETAAHFATAADSARASLGAFISEAVR